MVTRKIRAPRGWNFPHEWARRTMGAVVPVCVALVAVSPHKANAETIEAALARAYESNPQLNAQRAIVRQSDEGVLAGAVRLSPDADGERERRRPITD